MPFPTEGVFATVVVDGEGGDRDRGSRPFDREREGRFRVVGAVDQAVIQRTPGTYRSPDKNRRQSEDPAASGPSRPSLRRRTSPELIVNPSRVARLGLGSNALRDAMTV